MTIPSSGAPAARGGRATPPGLLVVDKPAGWTSHDVVARVRRRAGTKRVGHAGTLDPMATGVLVVGIGGATRLLGFVGGADKDYDATIRLGVSTMTDDAEGEVTVRTDAGRVGNVEIAAGIAALPGDILQVPSSVSAIKVDGQRSYARVRAGEDVELAPRPVTVSRFNEVGMRCDHHEGVTFVDVEAELTVSSGTYVRALARDLGAALGVGGHLTALRRTRVGGFTLADARTLDELGALVEEGRPLPVVPLAHAARAALPDRDVTAAEAEELSHGRRVARVPADGQPDADRPLALVGPRGDLVALVVAEGDGALRPIAVLSGTTMATP